MPVWAWDAPTAPLDPLSAALIARWLEYAPIASENPNMTLAQYGVVVVYPVSGDPRYSIPRTSQGGSILARIPVGTQPAGGGDQHLTVVSAVDNEEIDFYDAVFDAGTGRISSCQAAVSFPIGSVNEQTSGWGGNAANTAQRRGLITPEDVTAYKANGTIPAKTLQFANQWIGPGTVGRFPALHNADTSAGSVNDAHVLPVGTINVDGGYQGVAVGAFRAAGFATTASGSNGVVQHTGKSAGVSRTGATVVTSTLVTGLLQTSDLHVGQKVTGAGIPAATRIATIASGTSITLSNAATATGTPTLAFASCLTGCTGGSGTLAASTVFYPCLSDGSPIQLVEGMWIALDPALNIDALGLPAWQAMIAKMMQLYGMILRDNAGATTIYAEDVRNRGGASLWSTADAALTGNSAGLSASFPWSSARLLTAPSDVVVVGQVVEPDSALPVVVSAAVVVPVVQALEADSAFVVSPLFASGVGQVVESDQALAIAADAAVAVPVGISSGTNAALPVTATAAVVVPVVQAVEADQALGVGIVSDQVVGVGQAAEADSGLLVNVGSGSGPQTVMLVEALEADSGLPLVAGVGVPVGVALESDLALVLSGRRRRRRRRLLVGCGR